MTAGVSGLPIMMRYGYDRSVATGTIAASGTLAQIVPPSLVLIVMSDQLGRSVGDMYVGALLPAVMIMGMYCLYIFGLTLLSPKKVPALPIEARTLGGGVTSLFVVIAVAVGTHFALYEFAFSDLRYETRFVWSATIATALALSFSLINRQFKLGIISRLAEQVIIVLIPPLALIFLSCVGHYILGYRNANRRWSDGCNGRLGSGAVKTSPYHHDAQGSTGFDNQTHSFCDVHSHRCARVRLNLLWHQWAHLD